MNLYCFAVVDHVLYRSYNVKFKKKNRIDIIMTHEIGIFELQMSTSLQDEKVTGNVLEYLFS